MTGTPSASNGLLRTVAPILHFLLVQFGWPIAGSYAVVAARAGGGRLATASLALAAALLSFVVGALLLRLEQVERATWRDHFRLAVLLYAAAAAAGVQALNSYIEAGQWSTVFSFVAVWEVGALVGSAACIQWSARKQLFESELSGQRGRLAPRQSALPTAVGIIGTVLALSTAAIFGQYLYLLPFYIGMSR